MDTEVQEMFKKIKDWIKGKTPIKERLDAEEGYLKRIQEIIILTDAVHSSLEKAIRKRLPPPEERFEEQYEEPRRPMRSDYQ